jgi:hypothetical protein
MKQFKLELPGSVHTIRMPGPTYRRLFYDIATWKYGRSPTKEMADRLTKKLKCEHGEVKGLIEEKAAQLFPGKKQKFAPTIWAVLSGEV